MDEPNRTSESQQSDSHANHTESEPSSVNAKRQQEAETTVPYRAQPYPEDDVEKLKKALGEFYGWILRQNIQVHQWIIAGSTVASVFATVVIACIYWSQLGQMTISTGAAKSAAETASKQLELLDRPWISVALIPESPLAFSSDQLQFNLRVHLKNVGHAVATNVVIDHVAFLTPDPFHVVLSRQKALCEKTAEDTTGMNNGRLEMTLFPGSEDTSLFIGSNISMHEIMSNLIDTHNPNFHDKVFGPVYLVGCVDYQYSASPTHHQTRFAYQIGRVLPNFPPDVPALIKVGESVPTENVGMNRWIFGGDQAY